MHRNDDLPEVTEMTWKSFVDSLTSGIPHSDKRFLGLKMALLGYLIAMVGLLLLFSGFSRLGCLVAYFGAAIGTIGIVAQVITMVLRLR